MYQNKNRRNFFIISVEIFELREKEHEKLVNLETDSYLEFMQ